MGHGGNTVPRMTEMVKGIEKLDLLVVADPHPTTFAAISDRKNGTYLLPACTQFETSGSRTASNRSLQWGEQVVKPIFESKDDYEIIYLISKKLGFADAMFKNLEVHWVVVGLFSALLFLGAGRVATEFHIRFIAPKDPPKGRPSSIGVACFAIVAVGLLTRVIHHLYVGA